MNMFITGDSHSENVASYCDVHLNKMIIEQSQLMSNAHRIHDGRKGKIKNKKGELVDYDYVLFHFNENNNFPVLYKMSHQGHPCTKWIAESIANYQYGFELLCAMHEEYKHRFEKEHASKKILDVLKDHPLNMTKTAFTDLKLVTDIDVSDSDVINGYREVFNKKFIDWTTTNMELSKGLPSKRKRKVKIVWTKRSVPSFIKPNVKEMIEKYG